MLVDAGCVDNLMSHSLASEVVMLALAKKLKADEQLWAMTGLIHDLDYHLISGDMSRHGLLAAQMLEGKLPNDAIHAIKAHNAEMTGITPESQFDYALRCGETVTGMISAAALVRPSGIVGMEAKSVKKKMKDKAFAASVNRANIKECEMIGLSLDEFLAIAISSMASIAEQLDLLK